MSEVYEVIIVGGMRKALPAMAALAYKLNPVGNPNLNKEDEHTLRREMVKRALEVLTSEVSVPTHFE